MKAWLTTLWAGLQASFWVVPSCMALGAAGLASVLLSLDRNYGDAFAGTGWVWSGGADGARALLSTVATSMITVAGTVFSITIAALTLASTQFGPRLLRNFTRDRGNQMVLGTFIATFLYCLLVMRSVRSQNESLFIPNLAITAAVALTAASVAVLIYFIHHVASTIQAENLAATVSNELRKDIARLCPPASTEPGDDRPPPALPSGPPAVVLSATSGYIQTVNRDGLVAAADDRDVLLQLRHRPGDFVSAGQALLHAWPGGAEPDDTEPGDDLNGLRGSFHIGPQRTPTHDVRYGFRQLTEIAARALSPGINDPFTAMGCTDWLTDALADMAARRPISGVRRGKTGAARLLERPVGFPELLELSCAPIRIYAADNVVVMVHLLRALATLASRIADPNHREAIRLQAELIRAAADAALSLRPDHDRIRAAYDTAVAASA